MDLELSIGRRLRMFAAFSGATVLAWGTMPIGTRIVWPEYWASIVVVLVAGAILVRPAASGAGRGVIGGLLLYLLADGLLRDAGGGFRSGAGVLAFVPVLYIALVSRSRAALAVILAACGALLIVPVLIIGAPEYPASQFRYAVLVVAVSGIIGAVVQSLVAHVQSVAGEALARGRMLEEVSRVARALFDSDDVRHDTCVAAATIGSASAALVYEPRGEDLVCTAITDRRVTPGTISAAPGSVVAQVFRSGVARFCDGQDVAARVGSRELWELAGSPQATLYEPLVHQGLVVGVLAVGWARRELADDSRRSVIALVAHEAAGALQRADALVSLADEAQTDPLTGLCNRRAWDAALARADRSGAPLTLAILDLDNFKQYNDSHGHPQGDHLLRLTAAAWREQLRTGDLLARIGGEEFGLLISDVSEETALEIVERLRGHVPEGRTCSAGVARARPEESTESLVARADRALYEAKAAGRDRTGVSA